MSASSPDALVSYRYAYRRMWVLLGVFCIVLPLFMLFSLGLGALSISAADICRIVWGKITAQASWYANVPEAARVVIWELRLPRILCGALVGAGLACAGVIFQAILHNPLADPYTLGISTGASFGASVAIILNISFGFALPVPLLALGFAVLTLALVLLIARRGADPAGTNLIMAGIIVSAVLSAGVSFMKMLSGEHVSAIVFWIMGSLSARSWAEVGLLFPVVCFSGILAIIFAEDLNLLTLGERGAGALGLPVRKTRTFYLFLGAALTAICVSVCGVIGFIGLIVPHLLRFSVTSNNRRLLPLSMCLGALLLVAADDCARLISNGEVPVGVLTTLLGGPFFMYIFLRRGGARS